MDLNASILPPSFIPCEVLYTERNLTSVAAMCQSEVRRRGQSAAGGEGCAKSLMYEAVLESLASTQLDI